MDVTTEAPAVSNGRRALSAIRHDALRVATVLAVFSLALGLRLYGLGWDDGFPYTPTRTSGPF